MFRLVVLFLLLPTLVHAATYAATPSTFGTMLARLGPGDTLQLQSGTYAPMSYHRYRFPSGTSWSNAPVIEAAPGAQVRVRGIQLVGDIQYLIFRGLTIDAAYQHNEAVYIGRGTGHIRVEESEVTRGRQQGILVPDDSLGQNQFLRLNIHANGTRPHYHHGIYVSSGHNTIANSHIHHNAGYGIHLYNAGNATVNRNLVQNNRIEHNGQRGTTTFGLIVQDGTGNVVTGNTVRHNGTGDIRVADRTSGTVLSGNQTSVPDVRQAPTSGTASSPTQPTEEVPAPPRPPPPPAMPPRTQGLVLPPRPT